MSHDERLNALGQIVEESLAAWGFEPIPVSDGYDNEYTPAEFNPSSQTIEFQDKAIDESGESDDAFYELVGVALHEALHVAEQQSGTALVHGYLAYIGGAMAQEMFEGCESSADSTPADLPPYPFQSNYADTTGMLED